MSWPNPGTHNELCVCARWLIHFLSPSLHPPCYLSLSVYSSASTSSSLAVCRRSDTLTPSPSSHADTHLRDVSLASPPASASRHSAITSPSTYTFYHLSIKHFFCSLSVWFSTSLSMCSLSTTPTAKKEKCSRKRKRQKRKKETEKRNVRVRDRTSVWGADTQLLFDGISRTELAEQEVEKKFGRRDGQSSPHQGRDTRTHTHARTHTNHLKHFSKNFSVPFGYFI